VNTCSAQHYSTNLTVTIKILESAGSMSDLSNKSNRYHQNPRISREYEWPK